MAKIKRIGPSLAAQQANANNDEAEYQQQFAKPLSFGQDMPTPRDILKETQVAARESALNAQAEATTGQQELRVAEENVMAGMNNWSAANAYAKNATAAQLAASRPSQSHTNAVASQFGIPQGGAISNAQVIQEALAKMAPQHQAAANAKFRIRTMDAASKARLAQQTLTEQSAGLSPSFPGASLMTPSGATLDDNYIAATPEVAAAQARAKMEFRRELSDMLSGSDKTKWGGAKDYNTAVQNLPSVKKYGSLIGGTVYSDARKFMGPELRAQFDANDKNVANFTTWMGDQMVDFNRDGVPDTAATVWEAALQGDAPANRLVQMWQNDPTSQRWEADGDKIRLANPTLLAQGAAQMQMTEQARKVQESGVDAAAQADPRYEITYDAKGNKVLKPTAAADFAEAQGKAAMERGAKKAIAEEWLANLPEAQRSKFYIDPNYDVKPVPRDAEDLSAFFAPGSRQAKADPASQREIFRKYRSLVDRAAGIIEDKDVPSTDKLYAMGFKGNDAELIDAWKAQAQEKATNDAAKYAKANNIVGDAEVAPVEPSESRTVPASAPSAHGAAPVPVIEPSTVTPARAVEKPVAQMTDDEVLERYAMRFVSEAAAATKASVTGGLKSLYDAIPDSLLTRFARFGSGKLGQVKDIISAFTKGQKAVFASRIRAQIAAEQAANPQATASVAAPVETAAPGGVLDIETAKQLLIEAGGDKAKAAALATQRGLKF